MQDELLRAWDRLSSKRNGLVILSLLDVGNFFDWHKHFLVVTITTTAHNETQDEHKQWCQYLESKLRLLIVGLETTDIHPWPYSRFFHNHTDEVYQTYFCMALRFAPHVQSVALQNLTADFLHMVNSWSGRKSSMDLKLE